MRRVLDLGNELLSFIFGHAFAQCQSCAMPNVQDVNLVSSHRKEDSIFILPAAVKNLADFYFEILSFGRERTPFGEGLK